MILRLRGASFLLTAALACGAVAVGAQPHTASGVQSARVLKDKASYSLGVLMGTQLHQLGLTTDSIDFDRVRKALHDVVEGNVKPTAADRQNVKSLVERVSKHSSGAQVTRALKRKASYSLGLLMGTQLHQLGLSPDDLAFAQMTKGLRAMVQGSAKVTAADRQHVQALIEGARAKAARKNRTAAHKFLAANAKRKGVVTTASGLQYKVLHAGHGASPRPTDQVTVNYRGTLLDGTVFDTSKRHGGPATFPVDHVIRGWQEALVKMKPGAKWELYIPPALAYGDESRPPIPPGSLLKFEVELLSVRPGGASAGHAGRNGAGGAH